MQVHNDDPYIMKEGVVKRWNGVELGGKIVSGTQVIEMFGEDVVFKIDKEGGYRYSKG